MDRGKELGCVAPPTPSSYVAGKTSTGLPAASLSHASPKLTWRLNLFVRKTFFEVLNLRHPDEVREVPQRQQPVLHDLDGATVSVDPGQNLPYISGSRKQRADR